MGILPLTKTLVAIFHVFSSEDMKKYVMRERRVCFPAGSPQLNLAPF